jgi:hypothetical protein
MTPPTIGPSTYVAASANGALDSRRSPFGTMPMIAVVAST